METPTLQQQIDFIIEKKKTCMAHGFSNRVFMYDSIAQSLIALTLYHQAEKNEAMNSKRMTEDEINEGFNELCNL